MTHGLIVLCMVGLLLGVAPTPAEAGALRWVARTTWACPIIRGAVTGAARGAVKGAHVALDGVKVIGRAIY